MQNRETIPVSGIRNRKRENQYSNRRNDHRWPSTVLVRKYTAVEWLHKGAKITEKPKNFYNRSYNISYDNGSHFDRD